GDTQTNVSSKLQLNEWQKDRDARWTVKFSKAKPKEDGTRPERDLAIPHFGYKNHVSIDRGCGLIRRWLVTGARLREGLIDKQNTAGGNGPIPPIVQRPMSGS